MRIAIVWAVIGNVAYAVAQWGVIAVLAKFGNREMVGVFALGLASTTPVMLFAGLKLRSVFATDARDEYRPHHYLTLRLVTTGLALGAIITSAFRFGHTDETTVVICLVGLAKAFDAASDILYGYFQKLDRMDLIAISRFLQGVAQLASLTIAIALTHDIVMATLMWAMASAAITLAWDLPNALHARPRSTVATAGNSRRQLGAFPASEIKAYAVTLMRLAWMAIPLGLAAMLGSLWGNIPRYFINCF